MKTRGRVIIFDSMQEHHPLIRALPGEVYLFELGKSEKENALQPPGNMPPKDWIEIQKNILREQFLKDGTTRLSEVRANLIKRKGKTVGFTAIARDITERKRIEEEIRKSEEKYKNLVELAPDTIMTFNLKGVITSCNNASTKLSGYSKDELVGKHFSKIGLLRARDIPRFIKMSYSTARGKVPKPFEVVWLDKNGTEHIGEVRFNLLRENSKITGIQAIMRDITERKKTEGKIKASEEKYRNIVELAPDGIITVDMKGIITSINPAFSRHTGYSEEEIVGKYFTKLGTLRARDMPKYLKMMSFALRGKFPPPFEYSYVRKNGTIGWGEAHVGWLKKGDKKTGFQVLLRDTSERKKAERAELESQQKFKQLFIGNPESAVYVDPNFHILDVNPRFSQFFGYSLDKIKGKNINDIVVPEHLRKEADVFDKKAKKRLKQMSEDFNTIYGTIKK